jgi:hypothetical protein
MPYHSNGNSDSKQMDMLFLINSLQSRPIGRNTGQSVHFISKLHNKTISKEILLYILES